jgi:hypothetical protein
VAARVGAQLAIDRGDLDVERVDHRQRDGDLLTRGLGSAACSTQARFSREQIAPPRQPVGVEHGLDALLPLAALIAQHVTQPHPRP